MKLLYVFLVCIGAVLSLQLVAQVNLVPNGSFEEIEACPTSSTCSGSLELANGWYEPIICSTDLIHTCACPGQCCPANGVDPFGEGMIHMVLYGGYGFDSREYAAVRLIQPLEADSSYRFSVNLHSQNQGLTTVGSFGAHFSVDSVNDISNFQSVMNLVPQLQRDPNDLMSDFAIWYGWDDTLVANGGEEYVVIGNFLSDSLTPHDSPNFILTTSYLIDNVSLSKITKPNPDAINELKVAFGISPNPSNSIVQIEYDGNLKPKNTDVYTITGRLVKTDNWQSEVDVSGLPEGIYLLKVEFDNGAVGVERLVIQR